MYAAVKLKEKKKLFKSKKKIKNFDFLLYKKYALWRSIQLTKFPIIFKNYLVIYVYLVISCTIKCQKKTQKLYHLVPIFL